MLKSWDAETVSERVALGNGTAKPGLSGGHGWRDRCRAGDGRATLRWMKRGMALSPGTATGFDYMISRVMKGGLGNYSETSFRRMNPRPPVESSMGRV